MGHKQETEETNKADEAEADERSKGRRETETMVFWRQQCFVCLGRIGCWVRVVGLLDWVMGSLGWFGGPK